MKMKMWSLLAVLFLSVCVDVSTSFAADDDDYNFSWLDPDKKIYVLQNRRYRKTGAPELFLMGGTSFGDTYRNVYQVQPRLAFWFSEEYGMEVFYSGRFNSINNAYRALDNAIQQNGAASPYIREVNNQVGVMFNWAPWYSKINVFNSILYFDWLWELGAGSSNTSVGPRQKSDNPALWHDESLFTVFIGTGHEFHISEHFKVRWDVLGQFYSAAVYGGMPGAPSDKSIYSNFTFNLGIGYKF